MSDRAPRTPSGTSSKSQLDPNRPWDIERRWEDYAVAGEVNDDEKEDEKDVPILILWPAARKWFKDWTGISLEPLTWVLGCVVPLRHFPGEPHLRLLERHLLGIGGASGASDAPSGAAVVDRRADEFIRKVDELVYEYVEADRPEQIVERKEFRRAVQRATRLIGGTARLLRQLCADPWPGSPRSTGLVADPEDVHESRLQADAESPGESLERALARVVEKSRAPLKTAPGGVVASAAELEDLLEGFAKFVALRARQAEEAPPAGATSNSPVPPSSGSARATKATKAKKRAGLRAARSASRSDAARGQTTLMLHILHRTLRWQPRRWAALVSVVLSLEEAERRLRGLAETRGSRGDKARPFREFVSEAAALLAHASPGDTFDKAALLCAGLDFATQDTRKVGPKGEIMIDLRMVRARVAKAVGRTRHRDRASPVAQEQRAKLPTGRPPRRRGVEVEAVGSVSGSPPSGARTRRPMKPPTNPRAVPALAQQRRGKVPRRSKPRSVKK